MNIGELDPALWRALADAGGQDRMSTGRRVLVLTALFYLLQSMDEGRAVREIRTRAVHGVGLSDLRQAVLAGGEKVERHDPNLAGILVSPLLEDALHGGASLIRQVTVASAILEGLGAIKPSEFGAWFDLALDEIAQGPTMGEVTTSRPLARLMLALAGVKPGMSLLDPAMGTGTVLSAAADLGAEIFGQEINFVAFALARLRLHLKGSGARIELGDSLLAPANFGGADIRRFDRVVCDPPSGAARELRQTRSDDFLFPSSRLETLFVQHCLRSLAPAGRAVILVGQGLLVRRGAEAELRAALVSQGALEGVIALPAGVVPWAGVSLAIVLLRGSGPATEIPPVTFLDAADLTVDARRGGERLSDEIIGEIIEAYESNAGPATSKCSVQLPSSEAAHNLLPSSYLPKPKVEYSDLSELRAELQEREERAELAAARLDALYPYLKLRL